MFRWMKVVKGCVPTLRRMIDEMITGERDETPEKIIESIDVLLSCYVPIWDVETMQKIIDEYWAAVAHDLDNDPDLKDHHHDPFPNHK